jgi:ATP-dependent RNA helicase DDX52/ROK1
MVVDGELPADLDFFKYAKGGTNKRKAPEQPQAQKAKKRRTADDSEGEAETEEDDNDPPNSAPLMPKYRVTAKGSTVPDHVDSFDALNDRYHVSSRLLTNLSENGYAHPTGIQSYGIPILLEVRFSLFQAITALIIFCSLAISRPYHPLAQAKHYRIYCLL